MNTTQSVPRLESEIEALRRELLSLGPLHPGSISRQYHVCASPGCHCHHPRRPQRHGPYHKLVFVYRGRPVCRFVRPESLPKLQKRLTNYKRFRALIDQWIALSIQMGIIEFFNKPAIPKQPGGKRPVRPRIRRHR